MSKLSKIKFSKAALAPPFSVGTDTLIPPRVEVGIQKSSIQRKRKHKKSVTYLREFICCMMRVQYGGGCFWCCSFAYTLACLGEGEGEGEARKRKEEKSWRGVGGGKRPSDFRRIFSLSAPQTTLATRLLSLMCLLSRFMVTHRRQCKRKRDAYGCVM